MAGLLGGTTKQRGLLGGVSGGFGTQKADLTTSAGLYQLAVQSGLQKDADRILATQKGEETKKIFSGGFISDIFDVLNTLQYGVVGVLKGKGFMEGIKTRQSFSDKDALGDNGLPGVIAGIALDIAVDPLTYIAPATILKKIPGLTKLGKAIKGLAFGKKVEKTIETAEGLKKFMDIEGGSRLGKWLSQKFVWMLGADPIFKETYERSIKNIATGTQNIADMTRGVANISPEIAKKILSKDETGRFIRTPLNTLKKVLKPDEFENVSKFYNKLDDLGKQAVDLKLLSRGKFEENVGEYIKNAYLEYEQKKGKGIFAAMKAGIKGIKARKAGLTPEAMAKLRQIDNPGYLLFKSSFDLVKDIENAKLFQVVLKNFASDVAQAGLKQLPKTARLGELAGKFIPENMFQYIQEISEPIKYTLGKKLVADFKFFKVVMNPATHARNIVSNSILNWWKLGIGPWNVQKYVSAGQDIVKNTDIWQRAQKVGAGVDTYASNEILNLLDSPDALGFGKKLGGYWGKFKKTMGNIYQNEESLAKLVAFKEILKKGLTDDAAWKMAELATFNYAQVTPFVRKLRTALFGFPFITFCVSPDTEILTDRGWKTFDFIDTKNDLTLAYDIKTKELKWQKIEEVFVFPYSGKMVSIRGRSLDILMTPNHRNIVERTLHRRKIGNKNEIQIIEANKLTKADKIIVAGNYLAPKEKTISDEMVELVGWFVTEGYLVKKYNAMFIGQTNPLGQKKIEELRKKLGTEKYHISLKKYKLGGYKPHKVYYFPAKIRDEVLKLAPNKKLKVEFLKKLTKEQLELLYQTILLADGHNPKNKKSNQVIIQNNGETANSIQILGVMLGKQFGWVKHDNGLSITATKGYKRQLKRNMPIKIDYNGIVWCPKTELGTWVARRNGKVFITGNTVKATPLAIETALKVPRRISVFGKIKQGIENLSDIKETERERASEPPWIRDGFYIKLPIKDKHGRSAYFDLTYIIPFGDLVSGNFIERQIKRTTGAKESLAEAAMAKSPALNFIKEIARNQDFYGNKIWKESDSADKQLGDLFRHFSKTYLPPLVADQIPGGYNEKGERQQRGLLGAIITPAQEENQKRTLMQEMLRNIGAKIQPIDADIQEMYQEWNSKKALESLLREKGLVSQFQRLYIPSSK